MTAHRLADRLYLLPDVPVLINGWGSDEGLGPFPVTTADLNDDGTTISLDYYFPPEVEIRP